MLVEDPLMELVMLQELMDLGLLLPVDAIRWKCPMLHLHPCKSYLLLQGPVARMQKEYLLLTKRSLGLKSPFIAVVSKTQLSY